MFSSSSSSKSSNNYILVTGANKGIGLQIAKDLLNLESNYKIILTSRDVKRGQEAIKEIASSQDVKERLFYEQLDIEKEDSIKRFVDIVEQKYKSIYIVINNAAVLYESGNSIEDFFTAKIDEKSIKSTLDINVRGTIKFTEKILPYLEEKGRVIFLSSIAGILKFQGEEVVKLHTNSKITETEFYRFLDDFERLAKKDEHLKIGYHNSIYFDSKLFLNTYIRFLLNKHLKKTQTAFAIHPGSIKTDMNSFSDKSVNEGTLSTLTAVKFDEKEALGNHLKFINEDGTFIDY